MDIATHDEVPKEKVKGYSQWLGLPEILENHFEDVESFVNCYLLFYGTCGKCHNCYALKLCLRLNDEDC